MEFFEISKLLKYVTFDSKQHLLTPKHSQRHRLTCIRQNIQKGWKSKTGIFKKWPPDFRYGTFFDISKAEIYVTFHFQQLLLPHKSWQMHCLSSIRQKPSKFGKNVY